MSCKRCGASSDSIHEDFAIGEFSCDDCGFVWENDKQKDIVEFQEIGNGLKARLGTDVRYSENQHQTISKAVIRFEFLASRLSSSRDIINYSSEVFQSALKMGLTRGVGANIMAGACFYLANRIKNRPIMLFDISNALDLRVYTVGKAYKNLKDKLCLNVSDIDPSLFIGRFAQKLELGDQTDSVCDIALRIVARLKKDWISTGRRPSGITAVALLISCLIHRFDRNFEDVARIAGISKPTAKKRLQEFLQTSVVNLSLGEFMKDSCTDECNPPAYKTSIDDDNQEVSSNKAIQLTEKDYDKIEHEMQNIVGKLDSSKSDKFEDYSRLVNSVTQGSLDSAGLLDMVKNADDESDDEEELLGRVELVKQCINPSGMLSDTFSLLSKYETDFDDELVAGQTSVKAAVCQEEHVREPTGSLPFKVVMDIADHIFPDIIDADHFSDVDEEEIKAEINTPEESMRILKWFYGQKENRTYFRKLKERKLKKAEEDKLKEKRGLKRGRHSRALSRSLQNEELVAQFDREVLQASQLGVGRDNDEGGPSSVKMLRLSPGTEYGDDDVAGPSSSVKQDYDNEQCTTSYNNDEEEYGNCGEEEYGKDEEQLFSDYEEEEL